VRHDKNMNDLIYEYIMKGTDLPTETRETWNLVVDSLNTWPPGC
jgi:IS30 family transposase